MSTAAPPVIRIVSEKAQEPQREHQSRSASSETMRESTEQDLPRRSTRSTRGRPSPPDHVTSQDPMYSGLESRGTRKTSDDLPSKKRPRGRRDRIEDYDEEYLNSPMNEKELAEWKGWCEIESDPAFFNSIIREWGVKGVKIQEVIGLDDELLTFLPKPIYGLIFLFEYREDGPEKMEKCPDDVWFAHQVAQNSCASVALLNLVMNLPDVDIGDAITDLKRRTGSDTSPNQRGQAVKNCEFVRKVHNSFARKSDLFTQVKDLKQPRKPLPQGKPAKRKGKGFTTKKRKKATEEDDEENAFHFIAFVPINGKLWKLDGMDAQPMNLGRCGSDWMDLARPEISARMAAYENDAINFSLQALCASPLSTIPPQLAENVAQLLCVELILNTEHPDWAVYLDPDSSIASAEHLILGPDEEIGLTPQLLTRAKGTFETTEKFKPRITKPGNSMMELMDMRERIIKEQNRLRGAYMEEIVSVQQDDERTRNRRRSREENSEDRCSDKSAVELDPLSEGMNTVRSKNSPMEMSSSLSPAKRSTPAPEATSSPVPDTKTNTEGKENIAEKNDSIPSSDSSVDIPLKASLNIDSDMSSPKPNEP